MSKNHRHLFPILFSIILAFAFIWLSTFLSPVRGASNPFFLSTSSTNAIDAITIPETSVFVWIDGNCKNSEYSLAYTGTFTDSGGVIGDIYLEHDSDYLYACMVGAAGTYTDRFASLYLDTDYGMEIFAGSEDYGLRVDIVTGTNITLVGTGVGNYTPGGLDGWYGAASVGAADSIEFKVPITATGGLCNNNFGLALYHLWVDMGTGDDYGWPSRNYYDAPHTWSAVQFANPPCPPKLKYIFLPAIIRTP